MNYLRQYGLVVDTQSVQQLVKSEKFYVLTGSFFMGNNQKRVYPVRLESKTGTAWNQVKNTLDEARDWPKTNRTRFSEIMTRVHL